MMNPLSSRPAFRGLSSLRLFNKIAAEALWAQSKA
jgi:hypothetical protein